MVTTGMSPMEDAPGTSPKITQSRKRSDSWSSPSYVSHNGHTAMNNGESGRVNSATPPPISLGEVLESPMSPPSPRRSTTHALPDDEDDLDKLIDQAWESDAMPDPDEQADTVTEIVKRWTVLHDPRVPIRQKTRSAIKAEVGFQVLFKGEIFSASIFKLKILYF